MNISVATRLSGMDLTWLVFLVTAGSALSIALASSVFDFSVSLSGILCVGLIATGRREGYLVGLYNSVSYSILAYSNGLFGELYLNILFYLPTGLIGYFMWKQHTAKDKTVMMRQLRWPQRGWIGAVCVLATVALGLFLGRNPAQNTPYVDATTNVLSVVATFLMMWRYKEQWVLYIILNVVTLLMWTLRMRDGSEAGRLMILMWSLFLLNAVFGCWRWHSGAKQCTLESTRAG